MRRLGNRCSHPRRRYPKTTVTVPTCGKSWQIEPFQLWQRAFLLTEQWWRAATREVPGTTRHHEDVVSFVARQWLDLFAPANFVPTNPEVLQRTAATCGLNLAQGARNAIEDAWRVALQKPPAGVER